jgi:microcystin-dependent protein
MISPFAGVSAPDGWLLCYGQVLNATADPEYAALWNTIGITYGGSGIASFNVPDLRGRAVAGVDNMGGSDAGRLSLANTLGSEGGAETHILTPAETAIRNHTHTMKNHTHTMGNHTHSGTTGGESGHTHTFNAQTYQGASGSVNGVLRQGGSYSTAGALATHTHAFSTGGPSTDTTSGPSDNTTDGTTGGESDGSAHNNLQPTMVLNYIIKY